MPSTRRPQSRQPSCLCGPGIPPKGPLSPSWCSPAERIACVVDVFPAGKPRLDESEAFRTEPESLYFESSPCQRICRPCVPGDGETLAALLLSGDTGRTSRCFRCLRTAGVGLPITGDAAATADRPAGLRLRGCFPPENHYYNCGSFPDGAGKPGSESSARSGPAA